MNVRFSLVWLLTVLLVLLSPLSHAETTSRDRSFNLTFNYTESDHVRISFFSHSRHKGGNPYSRFNEHQPGFMGEWAPSRESPIRTFLGAVSNSRDCSALFYGVGLRSYTPEFARVSFVAGLDAAFVYYCYNDLPGYERVYQRLPEVLQRKAAPRLLEAEQGYYVAPLPIATLGVRYRITDRAYLGCDVRSLAGKANLFGCGFSRSF